MIFEKGRIFPFDLCIFRLRGLTMGAAVGILVNNIAQGLFEAAASSPLRLDKDENGVRMASSSHIPPGKLLRIIRQGIRPKSGGGYTVRFNSQNGFCSSHHNGTLVRRGTADFGIRARIRPYWFSPGAKITVTLTPLRS